MSAGPGWSAAFLPGAPVIVAALGGAADREDLRGLRAACVAAVGRVLGRGPDTVVCLGVGSTTRRHDPTAWGTLAGFGVQVPGERRPGDRPDPSLPLPLTLARLALRAAAGAGAGWAGELIQQEVGAGATAQECAQVAGSLPVAGAAWLVVADGTTTRTARAPGGLDPRAGGADQEVEVALRSADPDRLLALDRALATELGATGWPAWAALAAGARRAVRALPAGARPGSIAAELDYAGAPLGVGYLVGSWTVTEPVTGPR